MNYLKYTITILIASLSLSLYGQTQIAFVKTRGRIVNGVHVPGHGLQGATVDIQDGNTYLVQNEDGSFSFPVPSQSFEVKSVLKKDYELIDQDILKRLHHYSSDPLYIVMEKPEQQKQDLLESERNIRRTMRIEIQKREYELDSLKEAHKITTQEYQDALQKLYAAQSDNEKLISEMARQYAQIDYDQMTELNRQIHDAISNGRLSQADSLIHTKGSIQSRIEKVKHEEQILKERKLEIEEAQREYDDAKAGTIKEKEEIAEDCITLNKRFMLELNNDSAAYYIEQLVSLDSTDAYYLALVGEFYQKTFKDEKAEKYYLRALQICQQSFDDYVYEICAIKVNLTNIYVDYKDYAKAEELFKEAIEIIKHAKGKISSKIIEENAIEEIEIQLGLAGLYATMKQTSKADSLYQNIIELLQNGYYNYDEDEKQPIIASVYSILGMVYYYDNNYEISDSLNLKAINIIREMAHKDSFYYDNLGKSLFSYAFYKSFLGYYEECEPFLLEALDAINQTTEEDKDITIAQIQACLGSICKHTERPLESEKWYTEAIPVLRRYAQAMPEEYNKIMSFPIKEFAGLYKDMGRFDESETLYEEALKLDNYQALRDPDYTQFVASTENELGKIKIIQKRYNEADSLLNNALTIFKGLAQDDHAYDEYVIEIMENLSSLYFTIGNSLYKAQNYSESEIWLLKVLDIQSQLFSMNPDAHEHTLTTVLERMAILYWDSERFQEAEAMYDRCMDLAKKYSDKDSRHLLNYTDLVYKLSLIYHKINNYNAAYKVGNEWLPLLKKQAEEYPDLMLKDYAECLGNQSFYAIFQGQYAQAEQLARDGLEIDSTLHWIAANLASALLLQGKYKEAEKICRQYKDELKDTFLENFSQFDQAGVIPKKREKDVAKIKKLLNQKDN